MITREQVQEHELHRYLADASDLGIAPGGWPLTLDTELGNGNLFYCVSASSELAEYRQLYGCITLTVFND